jgi:hypothetical protein
MSAPRDVQAQVASVIPFRRFGPRTQRLMSQQFGRLDRNATVGTLAERHGGAGGGAGAEAGAPRAVPRAPGGPAAGAGGGGDGEDRRIANAPGVRERGVDPRLAEIVSAGAANLPPGYKVRMTSGGRHAGASGYHPSGRATDWEIVRPDGTAIRNQGEDREGLYTKLAQGAYGYQEERHPDLTGKFAWGGAFGTSRNNPNNPDLMHFDLGGERGRIGRYRRAAIGAVRPSQIARAAPSRVAGPPTAGGGPAEGLPVRRVPTTRFAPDGTPLGGVGGGRGVDPNVAPGPGMTRNLKGDWVPDMGMPDIRPAPPADAAFDPNTGQIDRAKGQQIWDEAERAWGDAPDPSNPQMSRRQRRDLARDYFRDNPWGPGRGEGEAQPADGATAESLKRSLENAKPKLPGYGAQLDMGLYDQSRQAHPEIEASFRDEPPTLRGETRRAGERTSREIPDWAKTAAGTIPAWTGALVPGAGLIEAAEAAQEGSYGKAAAIAALEAAGPLKAMVKGGKWAMRGLSAMEKINKLKSGTDVLAAAGVLGPTSAHGNPAEAPAYGAGSKALGVQRERETVDLLDRDMGREISGRIDGSADLNVNVRAPAGTTVAAKRRGTLFKPPKIDRSTQMEPAQAGPPVGGGFGDEMTAI